MVKHCCLAITLGLATPRNTAMWLAQPSSPEDWRAGAKSAAAGWASLTAAAAGQLLPPGWPAACTLRLLPGPGRQGLPVPQQRDWRGQHWSAVAPPAHADPSEHGRCPVQLCQLQSAVLMLMLNWQGYDLRGMAAHWLQVTQNP